MGTPKPIVYVVDDDPAVRDSLRWLLSSIDLEVETFPSAPDFLAAYRPDQLGCILVDVRMPGMSGLELQEELAARATALPVIIITGHSDVQMAVRAMKAGAFDFIEKPFNDQALLDLVQKAIEENQVMVRARLEYDDIRKRFDLLSPRERQVLEQIVAGEPNKRIAFHLGLSEKTVEAHRAKVMEKTKAGSLADLIKMATLLEAAKGNP
ncbi:MAG: response regulator transcription factor [Rhodospirillales bacterium]|jgi:FixJ family two-component response regulator|nr:response regulator transcription factor [Rhodospirillales bacterium]